MSVRFKRLSALLMAILLVSALLPTTALAAGKIETDQPVSLTINYKDGSKAISDAHFSIYKVAAVDEYTRMTLTQNFEVYKDTVSGLADLDHLTQERWLALASTLRGYILKDDLFPFAEGKTDSDGNLTFSDLEVGLYLVIGNRVTTSDDYTYTPVPFMVFLPGEDSVKNDWDYEVAAVLKFTKDHIPPDEPDRKVITRKVLKVWDDVGYEELRPVEIVVQLLRDGKVYDTQTLNKDNNWHYVWEKLDSDYEWDVIEKEVEDYTVSIIRSGITFIITNSYNPPDNPPDNPPPDEPTEDIPDEPELLVPKLPQTGILWWPVPLLLCAGLAFVMIGVIRRRKCN